MTNPTTKTQRPNRRKLLITEIVEQTTYEVHEALVRAQGTLPARALKKIEDEVLARSMRVLGTWAIGDLQDDCKKLTHIFNAVQSAAGLVNLQIAQEKPITNYNVKHGTIRNALANESGAVAAGEMNT